ncbi:MAG: metallophosphoesterase, partial [Sedimenticolaceae bacterium]
MADKSELQRRNGMLKATDDEFVEAWGKYQSITKVAAALGMSTRQTNTRRRQIEVDRGIKLNASKVVYGNQPGRVDLGILNGTVIVFSDAHFWGQRTTAHKGLIWAIRTLKPQAVICNGDAFDGAGISRFPRIGWTKQPTVLEELKACQDALGEIEEETKKARHNAWLVWCLGNHDA